MPSAARGQADPATSAHNPEARLKAIFSLICQPELHAGSLWSITVPTPCMNRRWPWAAMAATAACSRNGTLKFRHTQKVHDEGVLNEGSQKHCQAVVRCHGSARLVLSLGGHGLARDRLHAVRRVANGKDHQGVGHLGGDELQPRRRQRDPGRRLDLPHQRQRGRQCGSQVQGHEVGHQGQGDRDGLVAHTPLAHGSTERSPAGQQLLPVPRHQRQRRIRSPGRQERQRDLRRAARVCQRQGKTPTASWPHTPWASPMPS
jgi:hypothetical protein